MPTPNQTRQEINDRIHFVARYQLVDDHEFAFQRPVGRRVEVTFPNAERISEALKSDDYRGMYRRLVQRRVYNAKMLDGALMQFMYEFSGRTLLRHRLAFLPAPHRDESRKAPKTYLGDELHGEVIARKVVPFPLRYDYDAREDPPRPVEHPLSHLTLGQYKHCRVPVSAPVTPHWFFDFIVRNFYHAAFRRYADEMPVSSTAFDETIVPEERRVIHVAIPTSVGR